MLVSDAASVAVTLVARVLWAHRPLLGGVDGWAKPHAELDRPVHPDGAWGGVRSVTRPCKASMTCKWGVAIHARLRPCGSMPTGSHAHAFRLTHVTSLRRPFQPLCSITGAGAPLDCNLSQEFAESHTLFHFQI